MSESIYKNDELENEMTLEMIYFWYSDKVLDTLVYELFILCQRNTSGLSIPVIYHDN